MTTNALSWLNDLAQWLGRWVPRAVLVPPSHRGVRFGWRGDAVVKGPGLVIYWPILSELIQLPITTISIHSSGQILPVENTGQEFVPRINVISIAIQYRIFDVVKTAIKILNPHALVDNRVQAAVARNWNKATRTLDMDQVTVEMSEALEPYGIVLERIDRVSQGDGVAVKYLQDYNYTDSTNGTRPPPNS